MFKFPRLFKKLFLGSLFSLILYFSPWENCFAATPPQFQSVEEMSSWVQQRISDLNRSDTPPHQRFGLPFGSDLSVYDSESDALVVNLTSQLDAFSKSNLSNLPRPILEMLVDLSRRINDLSKIQSSLLEADEFIITIRLQSESIQKAKVFLRTLLMEAFVQEAGDSDYFLSATFTSSKELQIFIDAARETVSNKVGMFKNRPEDFDSSFNFIPHERFEELWGRVFEDWVAKDPFAKFHLFLRQFLEENLNIERIKKKPFEVLGICIGLSLRKDLFLEKAPGAQSPTVERVIDRIYQNHLVQFLEKIFKEVKPNEFRNIIESFREILYPGEADEMLKGFFANIHGVRPALAFKVLMENWLKLDKNRIAHGLLELLSKPDSSKVSPKMSLDRDFVISLLFRYAIAINRNIETTSFNVFAKWVAETDTPTSVWLEIESYHKTTRIFGSNSSAYDSNFHLFRIALLKRAKKEGNLELIKRLEREIADYKANLEFPASVFRSAPRCGAFLDRVLLKKNNK